ncbi:MAG TPA: hypothetical protein VFH92_09620 [Phenylobacterium sp.]|nr:hypothetical protein [Phenylobacterium sp.]
MPRPVLQVVAALLVVAWVATFGVSAFTAQGHGRLPGQRLDGVTGQPIPAQEATPLLGDERIQGAAPVAELSDEEKAKLDEAKEAKEEAAAKAKAEAAGIQPVQAAAPAAMPAAPSEAAPAAPPPPQPKTEEPPF